MNGLCSKAMLNYQRVHDFFYFLSGQANKSSGSAQVLQVLSKKGGDGSAQFGMNISPRVCLEIGHNYT